MILGYKILFKIVNNIILIAIELAFCSINLGDLMELAVLVCAQLLIKLLSFSQNNLDLGKHPLKDSLVDSNSL